MQGHFPDIVGDADLLSLPFAQSETIKPVFGKFPTGMTQAETHGDTSLCLL
jgi:hypothetical protein